MARGPVVHAKGSAATLSAFHLAMRTREEQSTHRGRSGRHRPRSVRVRVREQATLVNRWARAVSVRDERTEGEARGLTFAATMFCVMALRPEVRSGPTGALTSASAQLEARVDRGSQMRNGEEGELAPPRRTTRDELWQDDGGVERSSPLTT